MPRKPKFRPRITRVKLNPEQAVLFCSCSTLGWGNSSTYDPWTKRPVCVFYPKHTININNFVSGVIAS
ncbi:MAG: hypothetical protein ISS34_04260 [Candidatus Omnitrophica bacterium]|nr:hypothetical protein [Candidatus Omnitrophota bacterium]